jgi:hypothetical protein
MIKLKDILLEDTKKIQMNISKDGGFKDYDDTNMDEEEWEEFQSYLSGWLQDIEDEKERKRITKLTNKVLDVDSMITEFLMMDEDTRNILKDMSDEEKRNWKHLLFL